MLAKAVLLLFVNLASAQIPSLNQAPYLKVAETLPKVTDRHALLNCVGKYDRAWLPLQGALGDCRAVAKVLSDTGLVPAENIVQLSAESIQPTRANILYQLALLKSRKPKLLFVLLAGHGIERGDQVYFLPSDVVPDNFELLEATALNIRQLRTEIVRIQPDQLLSIVDICRTDPYASRSEGLDFYGALRKAFDAPPSREANATASVTWYAAASGQRAFECPNAAGEIGGCFTSTLVQGLAGAAGDERGVVTVQSLVNYTQVEVSRRVRDLYREQQDPVSIVTGFNRLTRLAVVGPRFTLLAPLTLSPALLIADRQTKSRSLMPLELTSPKIPVRHQHGKSSSPAALWLFADRLEVEERDNPSHARVALAADLVEIRITIRDGGKAFELVGRRGWRYQFHAAPDAESRIVRYGLRQTRKRVLPASSAIHHDR